MLVFDFLGRRHVTEKTRETEYVTTFGHSRGDGCGQANRAACALGLLRGEDLQDEVPGEVHIRINGLGTVVATRVHHEAIVCVYVTREVGRLAHVGPKCNCDIKRPTELCHPRDNPNRDPMSGPCGYYGGGRCGVYRGVEWQRSSSSSG
jgi:hypothetical protein